MNSSWSVRLSLVFVLLWMTGVLAHAETAAAADDDASQRADPPQKLGHEVFKWRAHRGSRRSDDNDVVSIGHDSLLASGETAGSVVSILGSSSSAGDATNVVSILGNTRVTGPVADTAVAILGNATIDSKVGGDAVAVLGNVELGPDAEVDGDVVAVLGTVHRDPAAIVHGGVHSIFPGDVGAIPWLQAWIRHCLIYGRPLALADGLGWAWTLALGFLAFYTVLALLFRSGISRCMQTVQTQPGHTALAALLTMLLTPVLMVVLCITVIGIAAVPFVAISLFCAVLFGKAVMLGWLGYRIMGDRPGPLGHPALAVVIGGALVLVLYLVPVLGFLVYKLLDIVGLGAVVYTLILVVRTRQAKAELPATPSMQAPSPAAPAPNATSTPSPAAASTPPPASSALPRAGFWIRMAALFLDIILIGVVLSLLHPLGHVHLVILAAYGAVMWKLRGSTVGGIVFDLRVVRLDGREVDWETAIVRALGCFLSLAVVGLGFIWIAFDAGNQAWHDKIAGTVVVRLPKA